MADFSQGCGESYSEEEFENAAQRLLGERYLELKALNSSPVQICNDFNRRYLSGLITEAHENSDDITLLLSVSADHFLGLRGSCFDDDEPIRERLIKLLESDMAADSR